MKYNRDGVYEKLYPKTLSGNVTMNDGNTLEQWKIEMNDRINDLEYVSDNPELWSGALPMGTTEIVNPSKKLSQCATGWILVFARVSDSDPNYSNYSYQHVPKLHLKVTTSPARWLKFILGNTQGRIVSKFILIEDDLIRGNSSNITSENDASEIKLIKVYEY